MKIKTAHSGTEFQNEAKKYVINMESEARKLHIKNCKSCPYSHYFFKYYDFDSYEEAIESGIEFLECRRCFTK